MQIHDPLTRLETTSLVKDWRVALLITIAVFATVIYSSRERKIDVSHIPVLGSELGFKGRKNAYSKSAKSFLERGYKEVRFRPSTTKIQLTFLSLTNSIRLFKSKLRKVRLPSRYQCV